MASRVEGLDSLKRRWGKIPARMKVAVKDAIDKSAEELVSMQRRLVPVDDGDLRDSIRVEPGRHELSVDVKAGDKKAFYAAMVEFGTLNASPQPFFFPPYRALRRRIRGRITRALRKAVKGNV